MCITVHTFSCTLIATSSIIHSLQGYDSYVHLCSYVAGINACTLLVGGAQKIVGAFLKQCNTYMYMGVLQRFGSRYTFIVREIQFEEVSIALACVIGPSQLSCLSSSGGSIYLESSVQV